MNAQLPVVQKAALMAGSRPMAIVPESIEQVWRLSELMSRSGLAPKDLDSPEKCAVAILHGLEVGLSPMQAVQKIAVINGRPTIWGDAALGLVKASGLCEDISENIRGEGDQMCAVCAVKRTGEMEKVREFSVDDAKQARLWGKVGPWQQYTKRMLQMRARGFALRDVFPDVLGGMYIREELEGSDDFKDVTPEPPTPPEPPAIEVTTEKEVMPTEKPSQRPSTTETPPRQETTQTSGGAQIENYAGEAMHHGPAEITADGTNRASASGRGQPAPEPPNPPSTDALGGKPETDAIPPGLRRAKGPPAFKLDAWLATFKKECEDKTPAQLLDLREKMIEPLKERLGHDGYNKAGDVLGAAMEVAQKKYAPKPIEPAFDPDAWYNDLSGAISGCTSIEQVIEIQKTVQHPALEKVSREFYSKGKKLVAAALMQLAEED